MTHADDFHANRTATGYYTGTEMRGLHAAQLLDEIEEMADRLAELKAEHAAILEELAD